MKKIDFTNFTTAEIHKMIKDGKITNQDVIDFYGNTQWDDVN